MKSFRKISLASFVVGVGTLAYGTFIGTEETLALFGAEIILFLIPVILHCVESAQSAKNVKELRRQIKCLKHENKRLYEELNSKNSSLDLLSGRVAKYNRWKSLLKNLEEP